MKARILRQAPAAESESGFQEAAPNPTIQAQRLREHTHIRSGSFADFGHRVDEGDLRGEEGVGCDFDQLCCGQIRDDDRGSIGKQGVKDPSQLAFRPFGRNPEDEAVRMQRVLNGESFPQKLRIPGKLKLGPDRRNVLSQPCQPCRGTDRYGRLAHQQGFTRNPGGKLREGSLYVAEVGSGRFRCLRGADTDEVDIAEACSLIEIRAEGKAP